MRISQKGLYALEAMTVLAENYGQRVMTIHRIAADERIPEKFLEAILLDLKRARLVDSVRGARGGYLLRRPPKKIFLGEIVRTIDGPLAPFGDAETLRRLVSRDKRHRPIFRLFLEVRDATSRIVDHTTLADLCCSRD